MSRHAWRSWRCLYGSGVHVCLRVALGVALFIWGADLHAQDVDDITHRSGSVVSAETNWRSLLPEHPGDAVLDAFEQRLLLVDQVQADLERGFEQQRSNALYDLLDKTIDAPTLDRPLPSPPAQNTTAADLLGNYTNQFAEPLQIGSLDEASRGLLVDYYNAYVQRAGEDIAELGQTIAAADHAEATKAMEYNLVLPFLHVPDYLWEVGDVQRLPSSIRHPEYLRHLEDLSLQLYRPMTAYSFARLSGQHQTSGEAVLDTREYLTNTTDRLLRTDRYDDAISCLRAQLRLAESEEDADTSRAARFRLSEVLGDTGHPTLSADGLLPLLTETAPDDVFGKAAMLRLKYLYKAEDFPSLFEESSRYQEDQRVTGYLPQVLYITWVAARRSDHLILADQLRKKFLLQFPSHPLAADIHFAEAMEALAKSDYDEAGRLLEYIEYRYPNSRLINRVKDIQTRLDESARGIGDVSASP